MLIYMVYIFHKSDIKIHDINKSNYKSKYGFIVIFIKYLIHVLNIQRFYNHSNHKKFEKNHL
jgi:hypothetical protein